MRKNKLKRGKQLNTIQKRENLNIVERLGHKGPGGAYHEYIIECVAKDGLIHNSTYIMFQKGPRHIESSQQGVIDQDLLEIVRDRLTCFTKGDMPTKETEEALKHLEIALMYLNKRTEDRIERNVLGTYKD